MDEDIQADHVYTDLSKSFDKIDYNILIDNCLRFISKVIYYNDK